jgi:putative DNA-invertase from lambdoid prophage Rac
LKRAVTYHRVSTLDQDPTLARAELRRAAEARGLEVVAEVEETGSGARNDRPGLQRVLELARTHQVEVVMVWKLDRFGRSTVDVLTNVQQLERAGVTFVATTQGLEVGREAGAMGQLVLQVMAAIAQFERAVISERTRLGMQGARARGRAVGRPKGARDARARRRRRAP